MEPEKFNHDADWEVIMPVRLLYVFIMLVCAAIFIGNPMLFAYSDQDTPLTYLKMALLVVLSLKVMYHARQRLKNNRSKGAFVVLDYGLLIAGGLAYTTLAVNLLRFYF